MNIHTFIRLFHFSIQLIHDDVNYMLSCNPDFSFLQPPVAEKHVFSLKGKSQSPPNEILAVTIKLKLALRDSYYI